MKSPATTWYLAEGATIGGFSLFYLLQNPAATDTTVQVRYLRPTGVPLTKSYVLPARSRVNIWVNQEEFPGVGKALANAEISAVIESQDDTPIIVERAMYRSNQGRVFNAGHESTGVSAPATDWFLAEGATGDFFDMFVLIANPTSVAADVTVTYLTEDGITYSRNLVAPANSRSGIWVDQEQFPGVPGTPLANAALSTTVRSTNGVPLVVERAMWWPGDSNTWHEAHNSAGSTVTGTRWAVAEGEVGGARGARDLPADRQHVGVRRQRHGDAAVRGRHVDGEDLRAAALVAHQRGGRAGLWRGGDRQALRRGDRVDRHDARADRRRARDVLERFCGRHQRARHEAAVGADAPERPTVDLKVDGYRTFQTVGRSPKSGRYDSSTARAGEPSAPSTLSGSTTNRYSPAAAFVRSRPSTMKTSLPRRARCVTGSEA